MTFPSLPPGTTGISFQGNGFVDSRPRQALLNGEACFSIVREIESLVPPVELVPSDYSLLYASDEPMCHDRWHTGPRGGLLLSIYSGLLRVCVTGPDEAALRDALAEVMDKAGTPETRALRMRIWRSGDEGPRVEVRSLDAQPWAEVACNYPGSARHQLASLMSAGPPTGSGRLLLWHGEPGTGKTTATLALLEAWYPWCTPHIISDPERMFTDADYLMTVLSYTHELGGRGIDPTAVRKSTWKLIVCEDADEYLRSDARARSGPALGRLLNATDGLLGRGTRSLILLTTNDELGRLHPAVTRPGRCLSLIEFPRFSGSEASSWLGAAVPSQGATLAELYQLREGGQLSAPDERIGAYL